MVGGLGVLGGLWGLGVLSGLSDLGGLGAFGGRWGLSYNADSELQLGWKAQVYWIEANIKTMSTNRLLDEG